MSDDGIPEDVRRFITEQIASIEQLEVLLLLFQGGRREFSAVGISKQLYTSAESVERWLSSMCSSGLLVCRTGDEKLYQYKPSSGDLDRIVRLLANAYSERRVSIINLVFAKPLDHIRTFADAFKFKKDDQ